MTAFKWTHPRANRTSIAEFETSPNVSKLPETFPAPDVKYPPMKISVGADHAGYELKNAIKQHLQAAGYEVKDEGTNGPESVDYPAYAKLVADDVAQGRADRGILVCGSGIGMAISANKVPGIRAANICCDYEATMSREHNDLNVMTLGARIIDPAKALGLVDLWLKTEFAGGRHQRRVDKIAALDKEEHR